MSNSKLWIVNRMAALLPKPKLTASALLDAATRAEGSADFGPRDFEEGLEVLLRSLRDEARLSPMGRQGMHRLLVRTLVTRLRLVEDQRLRPQIYARPLTPPIMILGLPRSGTTFLQRLLSAMPDARPARTWELNQPLPPRRGKDDRYAQAVGQAKMIRRLMPELDGKHIVDPDEPEECVFLMNPSFRSLGWWMFAPVYGYLAWLDDQDLGPTYREYHAYLRALEATEAGRFVLKAPAHTPNVAELVAEIPGLVVVQTHRDPVPVTGSVSSLFASVHSLVTEDFAVERVARTNLDMLVRLTGRCMRAREEGDLDARVLDIRYDDLVGDPVGAARRIYAHGGIDWPEGGEASLRAHLEASKRARAGRPRHTYDLAEHGLSEAEVRERFADYTARYLG